MKISKKEIVKVNAGFGGRLRNDSSLDFAIGKQQESKIGEYKKLAYLWRAILIDRPFSNANKKTAMYVALAFVSEFNKTVDKDLLIHQIISIAKQNITSIRNIEWRIKNAIR